MKFERVLFAAALIAGASYVFADRLDLSPAATIAWKGAGVSLLALWCAMQARGIDGWLIAAVMAFGATGDVLIEAIGLEAGAGAFFVGHIVAIWLYLRNRREVLTGSQKLTANSVIIATPLIAWSLTQSIGVAFYATALGIMAATAWASRFPRYRVGIGAMLFVASDLLIFARLGPLASSAWAGMMIWPLYFAGQALIAWGVTRTLVKPR